MRTILYTGKGGVGKTSVAAATALRSAREGKKTLVVSTDPAHSLSDAFDERIGHDPHELATNLYGQEMDPGTMMELYWAEIQEYITRLFEWQGADKLTAEELALLPGMDELFGLLLVKNYYNSGEYDALLVDAAPTGETLRLLSLPDQLSWYVEKIFPLQRKAANFARPFTSRYQSLPPVPEDSFFGAAKKFYDQILGVEEILTDRENASIRLVVNAEKMVIAEARRAYTYLNLFNYGVDAIVVNRLLPEELTDAYFKQWLESQKRHLETIEEAFAPIPIFKGRLFEREMFGQEALNALSEDIFGEEDPLQVFFRGSAHEIRQSENGGGYEVILNLPLVEKAEVDLSKRGPELFVKAGGHRRTILLPDSMARLEATGARMEEGKLKVTLDEG